MKAPCAAAFVASVVGGEPHRLATTKSAREAVALSLRDLLHKDIKMGAFSTRMRHERPLILPGNKVRKLFAMLIGQDKAMHLAAHYYTSAIRRLRQQLLNKLSDCCDNICWVNFTMQGVDTSYKLGKWNTMDMLQT
ncbi:MAG: hypothetical protein NTZ34_12965 [Chloroflexi bacterium]|nr:hypothetical protein [Chloroflexota bacterium]